MDEEALARAESDVDTARRAVAAAAAALAAAEEVAALERVGWSRAVAEARADLARVRRLVVVGARAGRELVEAERRFVDASRREIEGSTRWVGERGRLLRALVRATDAQWVRAAVGGVVIRADHASGTEGSVDVRLVMLRKGE